MEREDSPRLASESREEDAPARWRWRTLALAGRWANRIPGFLRFSIFTKTRGDSPKQPLVANQTGNNPPERICGEIRTMSCTSSKDPNCSCSAAAIRRVVRNPATRMVAAGMMSKRSPLLGMIIKASGSSSSVREGLLPSTPSPVGVYSRKRLPCWSVFHPVSLSTLRRCVGIWLIRAGRSGGLRLGRTSTPVGCSFCARGS